MTIGSPLINTGNPIPITPTPEFVDETDIPTYRSDYRFSGYKLNQDDVGITMAYPHQHQPKIWSLRAASGYTPVLANP